MDQLVAFYKKLGFTNFYNLINANIEHNKNEFIQSDRFLFGLNNSIVSPSNILECNTGDIRFDIPVWFGDINKAKSRIVVFGLEPRDTDSTFNIEKIENRVYATPFGVDRWIESSSVQRKPQNRYYRVFNELVNDHSNFVLFSDVVKDYYIDSKHNENRKNDIIARDLFFEKAYAELDFLKEEIELIKPTHIITLGLDSYNFIKANFSEMQIFKLRHPANGGENLAKKQIKELFGVSK
jgi:hypothetical protein